MEDLELGELLGSGGFADVFEATEHHLGRRVAVKIFRTRVDGMDEKSFVREAQAMGQLSGVRNVVQVYRSGLTDDNHPFLVMERMEYALSALVGSEEVSLDDSIRVGVLIGEALQVAHDAGILHRDLKPANILVDRYGEPKLSDFGISSLLRSDESSSIYAFSAEHAAPELFEEARSTRASDVYSLGATLFTLVEGRPPFERRTDEGPMSFMTRVMNEPVPHSPRAMAETPEFDSILRASMAKDPDERPDLSELDETLATLSAGQTGPGAPVRLPARAPEVLRSDADRTVPGKGSSGRADEPKDPEDDLTAHDSGGIEPPETRSSRLKSGVAILVLVLVGVAAIAVFATRSESSSEDQAGAAPSAGIDKEDVSTTASTQTTEPQGDRLNGVENIRPLDTPGVQDTSGVLRQRIDQFATGSGIPAITTASVSQSQTGAELDFGALPSLVDYGGINKLNSSECYRVELHDLAVLGGARSLWADATTFSVLFAIEFATPKQALGYYWATAMFTGTASEDCDGWPADGIAIDPVDLSVERADFELSSTPDDLFTSIHTDPKEIGFDAEIAYSALARSGSTVILAISGQLTGTGDPATHRSNLDQMLAAF